MPKYVVHYYECYSDAYEVYAENEEEAKEKVITMVGDAKFPAPDNCYDSGCEIVEELEEEE